MQLHQIQPKHKTRKRKRVGRGGKRGTYSGRGVKGQKSRSGARFQPVVRELIKKYPKLRGYKFKSRSKTQKSRLVVVDIKDLAGKFSDGETVNPQTLLRKKIIRKIKGKAPFVKLLGKGKPAKKLIFENCRFSKQARKEIEQSGATIK